MRGGAPSDGAQVGSAVELRDDQLDGDLTSLILERTKGHSDLLLTVGWYYTWRSKEKTIGMNGCLYEAYLISAVKYQQQLAKCRVNYAPKLSCNATIVS